MKREIKTLLARAPLLDVFGLLAIFSIGYIYTSEIFQYLDVGLYDESTYLQTGLMIPRSIPTAENAPLYAFWYRFLSLFERDNLMLYFFNYKAMTILPAMALFGALRVHGVSRVMSIALSLWILFSSANFSNWPKVTHFALTVMLLGVLGAGLVGKLTTKVAVLFVACLVASYARPEYFLSAVLFGILYVILLSRQFKSEGLKRCLPVSVALVVIAFSALMALGSPIASGNRSMIAFSQHYALNWVEWNNDGRIPWTHSDVIVKGDFGDVQTVGEALAANPRAFGRHVLSNMLHAPRELVSTFLSKYWLTDWARVGVAFGILFVVMAMTLHMWGRREVVVEGIRGKLRRGWFGLAVVSILLLPSIISVLLVYPREHYLLASGTIAALAIIVALAKGSGELDWRGREAMLLIIGLALLIVRPLSIPPGGAAQPNLKTIQYLRSLGISEQVNILEAEGGYGIYIGEHFHRVAEYDKKTPWSAFLAEKNIGLIVVSEVLARDPRFAGDPEWVSFVSAPETAGFASANIPGVEGRRLIYKEGMLPRKP
jgi:hypothetical protein